MKCINNIQENEDHTYEYYEIHDEIWRDILEQMVRRDKTPIRLTKINPSMYQQALIDFMRFGKITRYPIKNILKWKNIIIRNTIFLDVNTMFYGHTSYFDEDTFNDYVLNTDETGESIHDWGEAWEYMGERGYEEILDAFMPKFSNGHDLISDYGLEPLQRIVVELLQTDDPNQIIVLINKALDISHQRSDLSELFIEGGQASLNKISGLDENVINLIKEEIYKYFN